MKFGKQIGEANVVNRTIEQKRLKAKRRGRFARFSGALSKFKPPGKGSDTVFVGEVSFSKQVINTGRGPSAERMQEYYQRIHTYDQSLPDTVGAVPVDKIASGRKTEGGLHLKDFDLGAKYADFIKGASSQHRIRLIDDALAALDMFFEPTGHQWFFVEMDKKKMTLKRSTVYSSRKYAMLHLDMNKVTWVETLR